jgi:gluconolactonase
VNDTIKAEFEVLDERFRACDGDQWLERLYTGCRWTEGPAYFPAGRYLVWSDIPNDVVERSDGSIWFTDPSYGIDSDYEGNRAESEIGACHVYRADPVTGRVEIVADDFVRPNGLAFSLDERLLYIVDTRQQPSHIRVFRVEDGGKLTGGEIFGTCDAGVFDGIRLDDTGRVWAAAHDGLHCFATDGTLIGKLRLPEVVSNLTFGGPKLNHLFITASTSVYSLRVTFNGARTR